MIRKITISLIITAVLCIALVACDFDDRSGQQVRVTEPRFMLDTYVILTIHGYVAESVIEEAFDLIAELESLMSITIEGSDIYRINGSNGKPTIVDPRTIEVIRKSIEFSEISDGLFDITAGRLTRLWNFGENEAIPNETALIEAQKTVDFRQISILENTVTLSNPDAWIDLGATAKGYIADQVASFLIDNGITNALIDLGGDIKLIGSREDGNPWRLAIRNPFDQESEPFAAVIEVSDAAVISSGTYERSFEIDGIRYHHILDPNTAMSILTDVVSATVIAESGVIGEGLSTLAILKGSEAGTEILKTHPGFIGAILILEDGEIIEIGDVGRVA
ncbi:MAG: FAD:protein FMN transferase [Oscillospiraceae bacterium]|nr:FAD:protein FMN transferase [Oscillospiraceae bacterium]MCL2279650.1 FAD:protein FMN transferase [Oscillospiraceae bacterium]